MDSAGGWNEVTDYLSSEGWVSFNFQNIDPTDQLAIYQESARRVRENNKYIFQLKQERRYGQEYFVFITTTYNPELDETNNSSKMSAKFMVLNISDENV